MSVTDEIRSKLNIIDFISEYIHLEKKGKEYRGLCPFHNEKTPSFYVSEDKQLYHCFGCQKGGDVIKFLCDYENISYPESIEILANRLGLSLNKQDFYKNNEAFQFKKNLLDIYKQAARFYVAGLYAANQTAATYLNERGLNKDIITKFGLGYAPNSLNNLYLHLKSKEYDDKTLLKSGLFRLNKHEKIIDWFQNRLMFPIFDKRSNVIAFGGRVLTPDAAPKYVNSPETELFSKKNHLYGIHLANKSRADYFIACEGYMDVIALNLAGFDNAVASLGTALTTAQLNLIKTYTEHLYLMYDSDEAGYNAIKRAIPLAVNAGLYLKVVSLKPYKDPDEFIKAKGKEELQKRIDEAINPVFFQADALYAKVSLNDPDSKTVFYKELTDILSDIPDEITRNGYIESSSVRYHLDYSLLKSNVDRVGYNKEIKSHNKKEKLQDISVHKTNTAYSKAQSLFLSWISEETVLFPHIKDIIKADDFTSPLFQKIYEQLYEALDNGKEVPYHQLMTDLNNEDSNIVSGILAKGSNFSKNEFTLKELIIKIKTEAYNKYKNDLNNGNIQEPNKLQANKILMDKKKYIEQLKNTNLTF